MRNLVFIHGWGMSSRIWQPLINAMPGHAAHTVDLGFVAGGTTDWDDLTDPAVYITHSLGTQWLLHQWQKSGPPKDNTALVAINGFAAFNAFTGGDVLQTMQQGLAKNPAAQMALFWRRAAGKRKARFHAEEDQLNPARLADGLTMLAEGNEQATLQTLAMPHICLAAQGDSIVPAAATQAQWPADKTIWHETAAHMLPLEDPAWCAEKIESFLRN